MSQRSVITSGYVSLDIVSYRGRVWHAAGGTAGNVAAILGFLGWRASVATDVGNDHAGRRLASDLRRANVDVSMIRFRPNAVTPRVVHEITASAHRYVFTCPECGKLLPRSRRLPLDRGQHIVEMASIPEVFFFDRLSPATVMLAEHFAEAGSLVVFEPSTGGKWRHLIERAVRVAHVIKHADDRAVPHADHPPSRGQVRVVTEGAGGARFRVGHGNWHHSPAFPYPIVDAGGAGDWTTAGLVHGLMTEGRRTVRTVGDALRWAQALAAVSCGAPGARGLARQQSADAVLRAAQFIEEKRELPNARAEVLRRANRVRASGVCPWCLMPDTAGESFQLRSVDQAV